MARERSLDQNSGVTSKPSSSRFNAGEGDDLRPEYDLRELFKNGVRGKYAKLPSPRQERSRA